MWFLRKSTQPLQVEAVYSGQPDLFSIELHHGGHFTKTPNVKYVEGTVTFVDFLDIDEFSVHELDNIMLDLEYCVPPVIYYHFRLPGEGIPFGLRALGNDDDVHNLAQYVKEHKLIKVYTEHGKTNLPTYFMSPKSAHHVTIREIDEIDAGEQHIAMMSITGPLSTSPAYSRRRDDGHRLEIDNSKCLTNCSRKLFLEWDNEDRLEGQKEHEGDVNVMHNNENVHVDVDEQIPEDVNEHEFNDDPMPESDNEHVGEDDSMPVGDNEHDGDDDESSDSEDSDFWVDEENLIPDVIVDMREFYMSVDTDAEFYEKRSSTNNKLVDDNSTSDNEEMDLEVIDNDEWDSLGEDSDLEMKRRSLLKELGKQKACSHGEVHKVSFFKGQKYKTKKELKERIHIHALETKRDLVFKKK